MASAAGSPPSSPLQDNVDAERRLREAEDHLYEAIEELQICLIIGFSSQESRLKLGILLLHKGHLNLLPENLWPLILFFIANNSRNLLSFRVWD
nr:hypothetical protein CFP56_57297 [Quercus suber]